MLSIYYSSSYISYHKEGGCWVFTNHLIIFHTIQRGGCWVFTTHLIIFHTIQRGDTEYLLLILIYFIPYWRGILSNHLILFHTIQSADAEYLLLILLYFIPYRVQMLSIYYSYYYISYHKERGCWLFTTHLVTFDTIQSGDAEYLLCI